MEYYEIIKSMKADKKEIAELVKGKGRDALAEIAEVYKISPEKARRYLKSLGIIVRRTRIRPELEELAKQGLTQAEIGAKLGVSTQTVSNYLITRGLIDNYKKNKQGAISPILEELAQQGLKQAEIGARLGVTRQAVSNYLIRNGLIDAFKEKRKQLKMQKQDEKSARKQLLTMFSGLMTGRALQLARQESWGAEQAFIYCQRAGFDPRRVQRFEKIKQVFDNYHDALQKGKKITYAELAKISGVKYSSNIWRMVVDIFGKNSKNAMQKRNHYQDEVRQAIKRAYSLDMSNRDIAYLVGIAFSMEVGAQEVLKGFSQIGSRPEKPRHIAALWYKRHQRFFLDYADASRIYDAINKGVGLLELPKKLNLEKNVVAYAINFRSGIERKIIEALDVIDPSKKHTKAY